MKMTAIILFVFAFIISARTNAQTVTLTVKNTPLEKVFAEVQRQTGYRVAYNAEILRNTKPVTMQVTKIGLEEFMHLLFKNQDLAFTIRSKTVVVRGKEKRISLLNEETVKGVFSLRLKIQDSMGQALSGTTVMVKGRKVSGVTNGEGKVSIDVGEGDVLVVSYVGYERKSVVVREAELSAGSLVVVLRPVVGKLEEVEVVSTGYQEISRQKTTGSFELIDNKLLNRRVSSNVLDRLEGIVAGVIFNKNTQGRTNESALSIRSRGTIFANPNPLVIIDNFPYQGDLSSINPNDIESITILKDAASSAIWGALSGNGVIVITTKKGKNNQPMRLSFNSNVTVSNRPDLHYLPRLSSANYIDYEKFLFQNQHFNNLENNIQRPLISPAVEILIKERDGVITSAEAEQQLHELSQHDLYDDQEKFLYQPSITQQYAINVSGGGRAHNFYISLGYDKGIENLKGNSNERITINAKNTLYFLDEKLQANVGVYFAKRSGIVGGVDYLGTFYPYLNLGTPANPLSIGRTYRENFVDTAGGGRLLDWRYYPLKEVGLNENVAKSNEYRLDGELKYAIFKGLQAALSYQYINASSTNGQLYDQSSFFTRDLINKYSQINYATGQVTRAIPLGSILDRTDANIQSYNLRGQLNYVRAWDEHDINLVAGVEQRENSTSRSSKRMYGYNNETMTDVPVDYYKEYLLFNSASMSRITNPFIPSSYNSINRYRSYFFNGFYRFAQKYSVSASVRRDESNLFGVNTNQKGVPLWSVGGAWEMHNEGFYYVGFLPYLKIRSSFGYNGNVDNSLSAYSTVTASGTNTFNAPIVVIRNPPNPDLRWEKTRIVNVGLDFKLSKERLSGSVEYYNKSGMDLISTNPIDPTTGFTSYTGNTANVKGHGIDVTLNALVIDRDFRWTTTFIFSKAIERVTKYLQSTGAMNTFLGTGTINPILNNPIYSLYAFKWAGLNPSSGNPQLIYDNKVSEEYSNLYRSTDISNLKFMGTIKPVYFGNWANVFQWKKLSLTINLSYKFRYQLRKLAINFNSLLDNDLVFNNDYQNRWKAPGDEAHTNIPSRIYPISSIRETVYSNAEINVFRGDHIRIQDIRIDYPIPVRYKHGKILLNVYGYVNNVGVLWKATEYKIDPDFVGSIKTPTSFAAGFNLSL